MLLLVAALILLWSSNDLLKNSASANDERKTAIENALYTKAEFFGAEAVVPLPTAEARKKLADVEKKIPMTRKLFKNLPS